MPPSRATIESRLGSTSRRMHLNPLTTSRLRRPHAPIAAADQNKAGPRSLLDGAALRAGLQANRFPPRHDGQPCPIYFHGRGRVIGKIM